MKKRLHNLIAIAAILAVAACSTVNETTMAAGNQHQNVIVAPESMIVQAADMDIAAAAVRSVGGEITHELVIIRGVGALLTPTQAVALEAMKGIRLSNDRSVEASSLTDVVGEERIKIRKGKVKWKLTNNGIDDVQIERIAVAWYASAGKLTKIKLGKKELAKLDAPPPALEIDQGWRGKPKDLVIKKGRHADL